MKLLKFNQKLLACFTVQELITFLLSKNLPSIFDIAISYSKGQAKEANEKVLSLAGFSSNSRDEHEFLVAIFGLYQEFENNCQFCYFLKDTFDPKKDIINTFDDLIKVKSDPPDVVVNHGGSFYNFEFKRYRGIVNERNLLQFLKEKILRYSEPFNFYIILQPQSDSKISLRIFENLHNGLKRLPKKGKIGRVCFSFNADNQFIVSVHIYPKYMIYKIPLIKGSEQIKTNL